MWKPATTSLLPAMERSCAAFRGFPWGELTQQGADEMMRQVGMAGRALTVASLFKKNG